MTKLFGRPRSLLLGLVLVLGQAPLPCRSRKLSAAEVKFWDACKAGQTSEVRKLLKGGEVDANESRGDGPGTPDRTCIHHAVRWPSCAPAPPISHARSRALRR